MVNKRFSFENVDLQTLFILTKETHFMLNYKCYIIFIIV